jgi:hypothetical protein
MCDDVLWGSVVWRLDLTKIPPFARPVLLGRLRLSGYFIEQAVDGRGSCFYLSLRDCLRRVQFTARDMRQEQIEYMLKNPNDQVHCSLNKDAEPLIEALCDLVRKECKKDLKEYCKVVLDGSNGQVHEAGDVDIGINCK